MFMFYLREAMLLSQIMTSQGHFTSQTPTPLGGSALRLPLFSNKMYIQCISHSDKTIQFPTAFLKCFFV